MASPTKQALRGLGKLVQYLLNTINYATSICIGPLGASKLMSSLNVSCSNSGEHLLERLVRVEEAGSVFCWRRVLRSGLLLHILHVPDPEERIFVIHGG